MRQLLIVSILVVLMTAFSLPVAGLRAHFQTSGTVSDVATSKDGSLVAVGTQTGKASGQVYLLNRQGSALWRYDADIAILSVAITPEGAFIVAAGVQFLGPSESYANGAIYCFSDEGTLLWNLTTQSMPVFFIRISPDGSHIIAQTGGDYSSTAPASQRAGPELLYLDLQGRVLWSYQTADINFAVSPGANYIVSTAQNSVSAIDLRGNLLWNHTGLTDFHGVTDFIDGSAISFDGKYIAVGGAREGGNGILYLFNSGGQVQWKRYFNDSVVSEVAISPDDQMVIVGTNYSTMAFDIRGQLLWSTSIPGGRLSLSAKGSTILEGIWRDFGGTILLLDLKGNILWSFPAGTIHNVEISADNSLLAAAAGPSDTGPFGPFSGSVYLFDQAEALNGLNINLGFPPLFPTLVGLIADGLIVLTTISIVRLKELRAVSDAINGLIS